MKIGLAQLNTRVGAIAENADNILRALAAAHDEHGCELLLCPELAISGYPPEDLLLHFGLRRQVAAALERIVGAHPGGRVAIVCHGGVVNAWAAHVLGLEPTLFFQPGYTSVSRFLAAGSGERSILSLNETAHLRG